MRIKVDFSEFFDDERKQAVVNVNTEETTSVRDVLHKIIRMFKLTPTAQKRRSSIRDISKEKLEIGLFEEGFYIHPNETSTVLQDIGILKLKSLSNVNEENGDGNKKKRKRHEENEDSDEEDEIVPANCSSKKTKVETVKNTRGRKTRQRRDSVETDENEEEEKEVKYTKKRKSRGRKGSISSEEEDGKVTTIKKVHSNKGSATSEDEGEDIRERKSPRKRVNKKQEVVDNKRERKTLQRRESASSGDEDQGATIEKGKSHKYKSSKGLEGNGNARRKSLQNKNNLGTDDQDECTKGNKGQRRKVKVEIDEDNQEEEEGNNKVRKNQRRRDTGQVDANVEHNMTEKSQSWKEMKEDEGHTKQRDARQKEIVETKENEEEDLTNKKGKQKTNTRSKSKAEVTNDESDNEELIKKRKKKGRRETEHESSEEEEEIKSNKKHKKENIKDVTPENLTQDDTLSKDKKKIDKSKNEIKKENVMEAKVSTEIRSTMPVLHESKKKRSTRSLLTETIESYANSANKELESISQEKEVSTSNVIHVDSDNVSGSNSSSSSDGDKLLDSQGKIIEADSVSSFSSEQTRTKVKRKRKHKKAKKRLRKNEVEEVPVPSQGRTRNKQPWNQQFKNSKVSTTSQGSHVVFNTDDEDEVTSVGNLCDEGNDVEIVGVASGSTKKCPTHEGEQFANCGYTDEFNPSLSSNMNLGQLFKHSTPIRSFQCNSTVNVNSFSNLQRMIERKTLTVVSVSSRTNSRATQQIQLPEIATSMGRGPPVSVFQGMPDLDEETRKMFYDILALKNRTVPLVLRTCREAFMSSVEDVNGSSDDQRSYQESDSDICEVESTEPEVVPVETTDETNKDICELMSMPSTSGYMENIKSPIDKPGSLSKSNRRSEPRPYQSLGSLLSNLRNPGKDQENFEDLHMAANNNEEVETINSASEDSDEGVVKGRDKNAKILDGTKTDTAVTSTQDVEVEEVEDKDLNSLCDKVNSSKTNLGEATSFLQGKVPVPLDECQNLMVEMIAQTLKEELPVEVQDDTVESDKRFQAYPIMKILPKVGEYIAIKVLSLDEKLRPIHSPYLQVRVLNVAGLMVTVRIIKDDKTSKQSERVTDDDGVEEVDLTFEEEVDLTVEEQDEILELDWRDIYEPRLLFP